MLASSKDLKNIPISISFLHDQEYKNICFAYKIVGSLDKHRCAHSESKHDKVSESKKILTYFPKEFGK